MHQISSDIRHYIVLALAEDVGSGDVTTLAAVPPSATARGWISARSPLVLCGLQLAEEAFHQVGPETKVRRCAQDGEHVVAGVPVLEVVGEARAILTAERVALNFLQRLSGIATLTSRFVQAVQGTSTRILDTRKTTPGLRALEKYAVLCGGGSNHRLGLFDMVLIKDNHLATLRGLTPNPIAAAIAATREQFPQLKVEVEADTLQQVAMALAARPDMILLDNMSLSELRAAVELVGGRVLTEASGNISLANVRQVAETGVDFVSVGALTHSAPAVDLGLDFESEPPSSTPQKTP